MTKRRSVIFFWVLFLVPTLLIAAAALNLLSHEQERINKSKVDALRQQADTIAQTVNLTLEGVRDNLINSLARLPQGSIKDILLEWEKTNPLVRNVFVYDESTKLIYPEKGLISTLEERQFMTRYDSLFSGRKQFTVQTQSAEKETAGNKTPYSLYSRPQKQSSRKELESLSRVQQAYPAQTAQAASDSFAAKAPEKGFDSGWIPWFYENSLSILIWVRQGDTGLVYGLELELMTLLSRLVTDFPELDSDGAALVLMDGSSNHIHQIGGLIVESRFKPAARISVSELLPHWQISVFMGEEITGTSNAFFVLSIAVLAVFVCAIVSGGILITRETLRNIRDARQKTSFVSSVSHELKTPLTSIRMYAELLLSGRIKDREKNKNYLSIIVTESERLTRLINNVLDFGRLEQGRKKYNLVEFDLAQLLDHVVETHQMRITDQSLEIIREIEDKDYWVRTDRDAIEQVILNLLDNALKYAGQGSYVKFVLAQGNDNQVILKICDDGPGIPAEKKEKIFEKFFRLDNSLTAAQPGSGLGLSICRQILRDLGGDLHIESQRQNGCCFAARIESHE